MKNLVEFMLDTFGNAWTRFMTSQSRFLLQLSSFLLVVNLGACSGNEEHPETVEKLRAIGVQIDPIMPVANSESALAGTVTFFALSNGQESPAFREAPIPSELARFGNLAPRFVANQDPITSSEYGPLRLIRVTGSLTQVSPLVFSISKRPIMKIPFSSIIDQGSESEEIVGEVFVADSAANVIDWGKLNATITHPYNASEIGSIDIDLKGEVEKVADEPVKISWFVSSGKVENRRSLLTKWTEIAPGEQVAVLTARGMKSRRFSYQVVTVRVL